MTQNESSQGPLNRPLTTGADTYFVNASDVSKRPTSGSDWFRSIGAGELNSSDVIEGGAGDDRITASIAEVVGGTIIKPALTSVETVSLTVTAGTGVLAASVADVTELDLADSTGVTAVNLAAANDTATKVSNAAQSVVVTVSGAGSTAVATVAYAGLSSATGGGSDSATIGLGRNADLLTLTAAGIENLTLDVAASSTGSASDVGIVTTSLESLTVKGAGNLTVTNALFDATDTGEVFAINTAAATGTVTLTTGTYNFNYTGGAGADVITSGTIAANQGNSVINTAGGDDVIIVTQSTNTAAATAVSTISIDAGAGDDVIEITGVAIATDLTATTAKEEESINVTVVAGDGDDVIAINDSNVSVSGGAGDDTLVVADLAKVTSKDSIDLGTGTDTVQVGDGTLNSSDAAALARIAGAEVLLTTAIAVTIDANAVSSTINQFQVVGGTTISFTAENSDSLTILGDRAGALTITPFLDGSANSASLTLVGGTDDVTGVDGVDILATGAVQAALVETLNINLVDVDADESALTAAAHSFTGAGADVTLASNALLTVNGAGSLELGTVDSLNVTVDASGLAGSINVSATSGNVTVKGGSGGDTITTGAGIDNIVAGGGIDNITSGAGADTINLAEATAKQDTLNYAAGDYATTSDLDSVTGFTLGNLSTSDKLDLVSGTITTAVLAAGAVDVSGATTDATDVITATVSAAGLITLGGANAANVDTLTEWLAVADTAGVIADGKTAAFVLAGNTYVVETAGVGGAIDTVVKLVGVEATGLSIAAGSSSSLVLIG